MHDLKGLSLPIHIMVSENLRRANSCKQFVTHRIPQGLNPSHVFDLGGGLYVASPELALMRPRAHVQSIALAQDLFEACGLYARAPKTPACQLALNKLLESSHPSVQPAANSSAALSAYYDFDGSRVAHVDTFGNPLPWTLSKAAQGQPTDLWKRPPLTTRDDLEAFASTIRGARNSKRVLEALGLVQNGSASPLETKACIMLTSSVWQGGEGWRKPFLNRRIALDRNAQAVSHQHYCIGDMVWPDTMGLVELLGEAYHTDRMGFKKETGRSAALDYLGYNLVEFTYEQLANLEIYDTLIGTYADRLGFRIPDRTPSFLRRRTLLHNELFGR
ncbi:MAG: hypothetical protein Q4B77_05340 [Coriobacteriaceae bacterium]|nr:hypothetical protein [Coriobacteriaceae bacterium]